MSGPPLVIRSSTFFTFLRFYGHARPDRALVAEIWMCCVYRHLASILCIFTVTAAVDLTAVALKTIGWSR